MGTHLGYHVIQVEALPFGYGEGVGGGHARALVEELGLALVHGHGARRHARPDVGQADGLEEALQGPILAATAMGAEECDVEAAAQERPQVVGVRMVQERDLIARLLEGLLRALARGEGYITLAAGATSYQRHLAILRRRYSEHMYSLIEPRR